PLTRHFTSELSMPSDDGPVTPTIEPSPQREPFATETMTLAPAWWGGELSVDQEGPRIKTLPQDVRLAGSEDASVLAGRPLGDGMLYLLLDDSAWTNEGFDQADN